MERKLLIEYLEWPVEKTLRLLDWSRNIVCLLAVAYIALVPEFFPQYTGPMWIMFVFGLMWVYSWTTVALAPPGEITNMIKRCRIRRGFCGECDYDLHGTSHTHCSECGSKVP